MPSEITIESLDALKSLIGTHEHIRLEFKSSWLLFYDKTTGSIKKSEYVDNLSSHISGFANTEGGQIILGLETTKTGNEPDTATALDKGLAYKDLSPETIQRALEASISPPLPGLRFIPIRTEHDEGRYYLVIEVPKGNTAHQAKDKVYYGRLEFETVRLHDNVVRLLMTRAKEPHAVVRLDNTEKKLARSVTGHIEYHFQLFVENDGEINISEFKLEARAYEPFRGFFMTQSDPSKHLFGQGVAYVFRDGWPAPEGSALSGGKSRGKPVSISIYPGDRLLIQKYDFSYEFPDEAVSDDQYIAQFLSEYKNKLTETSGDRKKTSQMLDAMRQHLEDNRDKSFQLHWTLYLPNTQPVRGQIQLWDTFGLTEDSADE
jgi:hypothetical protein